MEFIVLRVSYFYTSIIKNHLPKHNFFVGFFSIYYSTSFHTKNELGQYDGN